MSLATIEFWVIMPSMLMGAYYLIRICLLKQAARAKTPWELWFRAAICFAIGFGVGGSLSTYRIIHAERPHVVGTIENLHVFKGKNSESRFDLVGLDGSRVTLSTGYVGWHLGDGEVVDVTYLSDWNQVLHLTSVSGPKDGWEINRGDDLTSAKFSVVVGILSGLISLVLLFKRTTA